MIVTEEEEDELEALSEGSMCSEGGRADTDDEGIERDSEPAPRRKRKRRRFVLRDVLEVRISQLASTCEIYDPVSFNTRQDSIKY